VEYEAAKRGEVTEDSVQRVMPTPWTGAAAGSGRTITQILAGINVAVFIAMAMAGGPSSLTDPTTQQLLPWGANFGPLTLSGQWWRLVTYMFVHGGILHIGFNMWCLWDLGALCESLYGPWTYLGLYFISGIAGGVASVGGHPSGLSVGASGAIFGLAGALIASFKLGEFSLPRTSISNVLRSLVVFVAFNLILGFVSTVTDNFAHLGGLLAGAMIGALVALLAPDHRAKGKRALALVLAAAVVAAGWLWVDRTRGFEVRVATATQLLSQNRTSDAIGVLQRIVRERPSYAPARYELALAYFDRKLYPQAESELKQVVELQPQNEAAPFVLGLTYLRQNRAADAQALFTAQIAKNADDPNAHFGLGKALAAQGNCAAAVQEYSTTARLDPTSPGVYYEMGKCDIALQKYDDAIPALEKEQQQNGDDRDIEAALAEAYNAKGMSAQAREAQHKAAQLPGGGTGE
jgi:rhomboid protease GluP